MSDPSPHPASSGAPPSPAADPVPRLERLARVPRLLVACDYDGTLAAIVDDPARAAPDPAAIVALRALSRLPSTEVAIVSGRPLADLHRFLQATDGMHLVGGHGAELESADGGGPVALPEAARERLEQVRAALERIAAVAPGLHAESKPTGVALHYRTAAPEDGAAARTAALEGPGRWPGVTVKEGRKVVELCVTDADKGGALERLRRRTAADAVLFVGDDVTDEDAFAVLGPRDLGVKVGGGDTRASTRIPDQPSVAPLLGRLAECRHVALAAADAVPIEHHAMLSDQRTIALLSPRGRLTWLCPARIDGPALFADLLGGPEAGHWTVAPADRLDAEGEPAGDAPHQRYEEDTLVVRTDWGDVSVVDYLDCAGGRPRQHAGRCELLRVLEGRGRVRVEFAPRLDFGRSPTALEAIEDGLVVHGGPEAIVLRAEGVAWSIETRGRHQTAIAEVELDPAEGPLALELRFGERPEGPPGAGGPRVLRVPRPEPLRREETARFWSDWAGALAIDGPHADVVRRSALLIRGLCHGPTGAIAAAGTTSLPEWIGGVRNWDYRFCWPRDASMAAAALLELGRPEEAIGLLEWLDRVVERLPSPDSLAPLYTVTGETPGPEAEIPELPGYAGSRPVRVGNAAAQQVQLDVFGPIADLIARLLDHGVPLTATRRHLVAAMRDAVVRRWRDPDHGIWEPRLPPDHHVHTKVMSWLTLVRCDHVAVRTGDPELAPPPGLADTIRDDVLEHAWDAELGTLTATYRGRSLDAATLWAGLSGMLEPDDERFLATVDMVDRVLRRGPTVDRYHHEDGLPGREGGFNLCTTWHVRALALVGRREEAERLLHAYLGLAGPAGLLAEQHDPESDRALGNVPQAYSHLGLIEAVLALR